MCIRDRECLLSERTMADLAALRASHEAGLACRERRHVVVMHVPLGILDGDGVEHLLHLQHSERGHVQDLSLAAAEQPGPVGPGNHPDLDIDLTNLGEAAPVKSNTLGYDTRTHDLLPVSYTHLRA